VEPMTILARPGRLRVTLSDDGVACVAMEDEAGKNKLSHEMVDALTEAFALLSQDQRVTAIILSGEGEAFSSGASREVLDDLLTGRRDSGELNLPRIMLDCAIPCISAMAGYAVGGGFALGIAADIVIVARESRYCLNFLNMGFTPGMGTTRLLEHVLSPALAHELLFTGEAVLGRQLEGRTGINYVLPREEVLSKAFDLAGRIAEKPRAALVALKRTLSLPRRQAFEAARTQEALMHAISFAQPEVSSLIEQAFLGSAHKG
jgi:polyketide biosynthesis enoyl-CoA hydratase PksI